jgi:putative two-component system response regulator
LSGRASIALFDALTTERPYNKAWTNEAAVSHIEAHADSHFDPA